MTAAAFPMRALDSMSATAQPNLNLAPGDVAPDDVEVRGLMERPSLDSTESNSSWSYEEAFKRNLGLIAREEQEKLRRCRVAIAGMGGVGGSHLMTLARLGFAKFSIADPDMFEVANFNRQFGATLASLRTNKAQVMADAARTINPDADIRILNKAVNDSNVDEFLEDCQIFIDGLDFFSIGARRLVFSRAREKGLWSITAGPIGFSAAWLLFDPNGMTFDQYFDLEDGQPKIDQVIAFAVGLTPRATHRGYLDLSSVNVSERTGPSVSPACQLASSVASTEAAKLAMGRGPVRPVPYFSQFDLYRNCLRTGRRRLGNRDPRQRFKRRLFKAYLSRLGVVPDERAV